MVRLGSMIVLAYPLTDCPSMRRAQELLSRARESAGLSQAALARKAGIPRSVLNAYERGHRQPGADAFLKLLACAGFDLKLVLRIDHERNARVFAEVLDLAERLPWRARRKLTYPPFRRSAG